MIPIILHLEKSNYTAPVKKIDCFDILEGFHHEIRDALVPFSQAISTLQHSRKWQPLIYTVIQNFKSFHEAEVAAHTRDEEIAFYPIIGVRWRESKTFDTIHAPTEYMLREHTDIASHIHAIGLLSEMLQQQPANKLALEALLGEAQAVLMILPLHMQKEEQFLFPQARKLLPKEDVETATTLIQQLHSK
ncbi:MAG: hypothetical protein COV45_01210 [Deltaproteobacteria bacterium CG11_big_fil_rev_8_21_14_0_20_47_16]|nr:MAG: hypothetical protein COV45_01210 [Deltaproteobacteria bacterium CG11_big_fil_rev_8_21_14_0_20_47_16]